MDIISVAARSRNMSKIKSTDTKVELLLRKSLYKLGYRYRVHFPVLGKPDIAFPKSKVAVFVHGCFWHMHGCKNSSIPKSNTVFWKNKLLKNKERDEKINETLKKDRWKIVIVWECDLENKFDKMIKTLSLFLAKNKCLNTSIVLPQNNAIA